MPLPLVNLISLETLLDHPSSLHPVPPLDLRSNVNNHHLRALSRHTIPPLNGPKHIPKNVYADLLAQKSRFQPQPVITGPDGPANRPKRVNNVITASPRLDSRDRLGSPNKLV